MTMTVAVKVALGTGVVDHKKRTVGNDGKHEKDDVGCLAPTRTHDFPEDGWVILH